LGITTIIAILLAIVLTLSLASSTFFFVSKTQKSTQEQGTRSSSEYLVKLASCIKIMSVKYQVNKLLEVTVKNCGNRDIDLEKEKINVLVESGSSSCIVTINSSNCPSCTGTIPPGNMRPIVINTTKALCENTNSNLTAFLESNLGKTTSLSMSAKYAYASTTFVPEYIVICQPMIEPKSVTGHFTQYLNIPFNVSSKSNLEDLIIIDIGLSCIGTNHPIQNITLYNNTDCTGSPVGSNTTHLLYNVKPSESNFCVSFTCTTNQEWWGATIKSCSSICTGICDVCSVDVYNA